jgi:hypothetical protein
LYQVDKTPVCEYVTFALWKFATEGTDVLKILAEDSRTKWVAFETFIARAFNRSLLVHYKKGSQNSQERIDIVRTYHQVQSNSTLQ